MDREQFTFYASFAKAIQRIRKAPDRAAAYDAVVNYALYGVTPDLDNLPDSVCIVFDLIRPNLDASRRKARGGKKGTKDKDEPESSEGAAEDGGEEADSPAEEGGKTEGSSEEDSGKIEGSSEEEADNKKENKKESKKKKEDECPPPLSPSRCIELISSDLALRSQDLKNTAWLWTQYKIEKRQTYKETGYRALLTQIRKAAEAYGDQSVIEVIMDSMSSNYQGIMFDRLKQRRPQSQAPRQQDPDLNASYRMMQGWANGQR